MSFKAKAVFYFHQRVRKKHHGFPAGYLAFADSARESLTIGELVLIKRDLTKFRKGHHLRALEELITLFRMVEENFHFKLSRLFISHPLLSRPRKAVFVITGPGNIVA